MRTMRFASTCAVAVVVTTIAVAAAQTRPTFAGRWTTDPDPALAAAPGAAGGARGAAPGARGGAGRSGDMGSGWGSTLTLTQDATRLTVTYAFFGRGDMQPPLAFVYAIDGSETKNTVMMGRGMQVETSSTAWDGDALVITTMHPFPDPATGKPGTYEVRRRLSLESPSSLVVETARSGVAGGPPSTVRTVDRKIAG